MRKCVQESVFFLLAKRIKLHHILTLLLKFMCKSAKCDKPKKKKTFFFVKTLKTLMSRF